MRHSTVSVGTVAGMQVLVPNVTTDHKGFYVSYNNYDTSVYGSDTTALVVGQMEKFYILNGDHRAGYAAVAESGLQACLDYFSEHAAEINFRSDKLEVNNHEVNQEV